eukprot:TRINITY_DN109523_c0_g1_i1.p1 TRINITY_DN109523_c0_g1~~TRINITY_DN109523_c0_g1_i1.p1  ORF type:complete len:330 (+),score=38.64 TRINITY_DN109523_c0_g1_i1:57-992(+)
MSRVRALLVCLLLHLGHVCGEVSCGGHKAEACSLCGGNASEQDQVSFCHGDCVWKDGSCTPKSEAETTVETTTQPKVELKVSCGNHRAEKCSQCPQGHSEGWCHGDCLWLRGDCVLAEEANRKAAEEEHRKIQSVPQLRSGGMGRGFGFNSVLNLAGLGVRSLPEPAPEDLYSGHVLNLVGTTIGHAVADIEKDVLVNCYASWCGHCHKFKPQYALLAQSLRHVSTLTIAQIECTQNDVGPMAPFVRGFPTVMLFPGGDRKHSPVPYFGSRTPDDMTKFLHANAFHAFSDTDPDSSAGTSEEGILGNEDDL